VSYQQFLLFLAKIKAGKMSNITPNDEKLWKNEGSTTAGKFRRH